MSAKPPYPPSLADLPLHRHDIVLGGRCWQIDAVRDQSALFAASDHFADFPFGLLLWESSIALARVLTAMPAAHGLRVLEIGAGVGFSGMAAAAAGASVRQTDHLAEALALCRHNAALNSVTGVDCVLGDWTNWHDDTRYDLVIGADVLYDIAAHAPVSAILERNLAPMGRALLTDPGRPQTPLFIEALSAAGWSVTSSIEEIPAIVPVRPEQLVPVTSIECRRGS